MKEKIKWLKEHKKEIAIGAGVLAGTTLLAVIGVKSSKALKDFGEKNIQSFKDCFDSGIDERYALNLEAIPIKDLGNIGNNFLKEIPEATEETLVQVIAYIEKKDLVV